MTKLLKRTGILVLALVVLVGAVLTTGCSTPKVAMTVDGTEYTTGEYLAYLYNTFYQNYVNGQLYYYDLYMEDYDVWNETYEYEGEELNLSDYISRQTQDIIVRQVAIQRLMEEYKISVSDEDKAKMEEELKDLKPDTFLDYGFNNDSYIRMYKEFNYNESTLFYALYGEGGQKAVPADDIRKYFDENYLSYKIISMPLVNSSGKDLTEKEKQDITKRLEEYLALYEKEKDFDKVIEKYQADEKAKEEASKTTTTTGKGNTTPAGTTATTTTTAAPTTTTTEAEATTGNCTATTTGEGTTTTTKAEDKEEETPKDPNRVDVDSKVSGDAELAKEIKKLKFNEVKIVEYKNSSGKATKALVLRLDPEADRGEDKDGKAVDYFADQNKAILYQLKNEEFNKDVDAKIEKLDVDINSRAVNACDPYEFRSMFAGQ